jgi:formylglycine-generating enzyme required for sulfatase activity
VDVQAGVTTIQQKAPTLPDLDDHIDGQDQQISDSGANTMVFAGKDPKSALPKGGAETNMLPGTAGARSEQQAPTAIMQMGRTTGPVEPDEVHETSHRSGDLDSASLKPLDMEPPASARQPIANQQTAEYASVSPPPASAEPTTLGLASESDSEGQSVGSENETAIFVSPAHQATPAVKEPPSAADVGTRIMAPEPPPKSSEPTRQMQSPPGTTGDRVAATGIISAPAKQEPAISTEPAAPFPQPEIASSQVTSQPPNKKTGAAIATAIVVVLLVAGAAYVGWLLFGRSRPAPPPPPVVVERPPVTPPAPEKPPAPVVPEGMLPVAAGTYTIGRDGADPLEQPAHKVDLRPFYIDRTEVTNSAYKKFMDATGHKPPSNWSGSMFPEGQADAPVTGVSWQDAADYAAWAGKRLPTEDEWEAAARGLDGRIYPWGNSWRTSLANIGQKPDKLTADQYPAGVKSVGRYPDGASPVGAVDMIGNAWEWVADEIKVYAGNTESTLTLTPGVKFRVIRGGAYDGNDKNECRLSRISRRKPAVPKGWISLREGREVRAVSSP